MPFIVLALIIAAALGGGISLAAQQALPGDELWGFKTEVNERAEQMLAVGEKAKAGLNLALAQTRLNEAVRLAAEGKLDADTRAKIEANFSAHANAVAERVAALQAAGDYAGAADIAARFQALVAARISALPNLRAALDAASSLSADAATKAAAH